MDPHQQLANVLHALIAVRSADLEDNHQPALAYHPPLILIEIDTNHDTRPPTLLDRYPHGVSEYHHAMDRLVAAGNMRRHTTKETL